MLSAPPQRSCSRSCSCHGGRGRPFFFFFFFYKGECVCCVRRLLQVVAYLRNSQPGPPLAHCAIWWCAGLSQITDIWNVWDQVFWGGYCFVNGLFICVQSGFEQWTDDLIFYNNDNLLCLRTFNWALLLLHRHMHRCISSLSCSVLHANLFQ